jgi:hypothetical protein
MSAADRIFETRLVPPRAPARFGLAEVYALIAAASFVVARFYPVLDIHYECPLRLLAGVPCATCGMTHAFVHLAHGRPAEALLWSPLGTALAAGAWAFAAADLVRLAAGWPLPAVSARTARRVAFAGLAALLANWAFLLLHGLGP